MIGRKEYITLNKKMSPKSKECQTLIIAFFVGGFICCIGQGVSDLLKYLVPTMAEKSLAMWTSAIMIFLGAFLTGLGIYDNIGKYAGAGSIIPITGFANSVVSPSMEYRSEGMVFGVMCKMFAVAGPIIVSGVTVSIGIGLIYWVIGLIK